MILVRVMILCHYLNYPIPVSSMKKGVIKLTVKLKVNCSWGSLF